LLEPDARKRARPVLRGARRREAPGLTDALERQRPRGLTLALAPLSVGLGRSQSTDRARREPRPVGAAHRRRVGCSLLAHGTSPNRGCTVTQRRVRTYARWRATGGTQRSCLSSIPAARPRPGWACATPWRSGGRALRSGDRPG